MSRILFVPSRILMAAMLLIAASLAAAPRSRLVRPPTVYVGQVHVVVSYVLSDAILQEVRLQEQELRAAGLRLDGNRLVAAPVPAAGFRVQIGNERTMVSGDGSFMVLPIPAGVTTGEVVGKEGALRATFAVRDHVVPLGSTAKPIVLNLDLSDRPNLMNEWDVSGGTTAFGGDHHQHDDAVKPLLCPGPNPADCTNDPNCPRNPTTCCLDYNGLCANGSRYAGNKCTLRFLQFTGST